MSRPHQRQHEQHHQPARIVRIEKQRGGEHHRQRAAVNPGHDAIGLSWEQSVKNVPPVELADGEEIQRRHQHAHPTREECGIQHQIMLGGERSA